MAALAAAFPDQVMLGNDLPLPDYYRALWMAELQVSTATHESLGTAPLEAMHTGTCCILPRLGSYPEITGEHPDVLYTLGEGRLHERLTYFLSIPAGGRPWPPTSSEPPPDTRPPSCCRGSPTCWTPCERHVRRTRLADAPAALEQLRTPTAGKVVRHAYQNRPVRPRHDLRVHLKLLDLTPLHRRPQRLHALRDHRSENEANQHPHEIGVGDHRKDQK